MAKLNLATVEERMKPLGKRETYDKEIIFEMLGAYGMLNRPVSFVRSTNLNINQSIQRALIRGFLICAT